MAIPQFKSLLRSGWLKWGLLIGFIMILGPIRPVYAADLTVTDLDPNINANGLCSLIEAIVNANDDAATHADCSAGSGADTVILDGNAIYTLTSVGSITPVHGPNGLPLITSEITIEGNGATIERSSDIGTPNFRIFRINPTGNLTLHAVTVRNGLAVRNSNVEIANHLGGGILNGGTLTI